MFNNKAWIFMLNMCSQCDMLSVPAVWGLPNVATNPAWGSPNVATSPAWGSPNVATSPAWGSPNVAMSPATLIHND